MGVVTIVERKVSWRKNRATLVIASLNAGKVTCPDCEKEINPDDLFCAGCGKRF